MPQSQVQSRRQKVQQWAPAEPVPIERVERTNATIVNLQQQAEFLSRHDLYTMEMDKGKNCYNCMGFGHITRYCRKRRNWERVWQERRIEYRDNQNTSNLNGKENLIVLDQTLVIIGLKYSLEQQTIHPNTTWTIGTY